ncbi:U3 snoRNP protein [Rhizina undulata]
MSDALLSDSSKTLSNSSLAMSSASSTTKLLGSLKTPHVFLRGPQELSLAALELVKEALDPLARAIANDGTGKNSEVLPEIYVEKFGPEDVWHQVSGVVERAVNASMGGGVRGVKRKADVISEDGSESESEIDGSESGESEGWGNEEGELEGEGAEIEGSESEDEEMGDGEDLEDGGITLASDDEEGQAALNRSEDEDEDDEDDEAKELVEDVHGLNDGFFSIDDFNRQTELLELEDARGTFEGGSDDDEDIDYNADPNELQSDSDSEEEVAPKPSKKENKNKKQKPKDDYEDEGQNDDYDGEEDEDDMEDMEDLDNANDIMYKDFFAPPAKKKSKNRAPKPQRSWREGPSNAGGEDEFSQIESNMERARRDLFDEDMSEHESNVELDGDPADPLSRRSAHQKRQSALTEQIRQLELANVAKKEWTLAGEARANDRPLNSLLEEDLEFERAGKPVPVITQEVTENLEDMIKRRILAAQFDEVIKRRPDDISSAFRRGKVEIDDSKPQEGLAEVYEKEHLRAVDPANNLEAKDEKLQKEHREIEGLWADVSRRLDALTSWHYTPKPPKPSITIVADAPAISMEEAQPSVAAGGMAANVSMLAPQEVYKPGQEKAVLPIGEGGGREIVGKSGAPVSTREMTSEEKQRRRRREKHKIRKRNAGLGMQGAVAKEGSKKDVVDSLKRGGVKIIGKGGEKRDVEGRLVKEDAKARNKSSGLKL